MIADRAPRVFFALWPPAEVADAIIARVAEQRPGGRAIARDRLHLTLAFHGRCDPDAIAALERRAARVSVSAFELVLDRIGGFARSRVTWLAPSDPPEVLTELALALAPESVSGAPCFVAHVSAARNTPRPPRRAVAPIRWPVSEFALVASAAHGPPGAYRDRARWPLAPVARAGL